MAARPEFERDKGWSPSKKAREGTTPASLRHQLSQRAGGVIAAIDQLRDLAALADLKLDFPKIVAIGPENCGKSSVLERLAHWSLFPRADGICTRMPIELRLIHQSPAELIAFCEANKLPYFADEGYCRMTYEKPGVSKPLKESKYMAFSKMKDLVKHYHDKFVKDMNGSLTGIISDLLVLEIKSSMVVNLRLIDLPGIIQASREGEPADICDQTTRLTEHFLQQPHTLVLGVVSATEGFRTSTAMGLVQKFKKQADTIGVLTKADRATDARPEAKANPYRELKAKLDGTSGDMISLPMGVVATRNHDSYFDEGITLDQVTAREEEWFESNLPGYLSDGKAGINALAEKLVSLLLKYTADRWVPDALSKIERALASKHKEMLLQCGIQPTTSETEAAKYLGEVIQKITQCWDQGSLADPERLFVDSAPSPSWGSHLIHPELDDLAVGHQFDKMLGWKTFKDRVYAVDFGAVCDSWVETVKSFWVQPFTDESAPIFIHRFGVLRDRVVALLQFHVTHETKLQFFQQLAQLLCHFDCFPEQRGEAPRRIQSLARLIFFERVFLPAFEANSLLEPSERSKNITTHLSIHPPSELLKESPEWATKRRGFLDTIKSLVRAREAIRGLTINP